MTIWLVAALLPSVKLYVPLPTVVVVVECGGSPAPQFSIHYNCFYENTWKLHWCRDGRSQWPRGLRHRSAAALRLRLLVRIPPEAWMFVCRECCVLSGWSLCDGLIIRPEESYRLWCVVECDLETLWMRRSWSTGGLSRQKQTNKRGDVSSDVSKRDASNIYTTWCHFFKYQVKGCNRCCF